MNELNHPIVTPGVIGNSSCQIRQTVILKEAPARALRPTENLWRRLKNLYAGRQDHIGWMMRGLNKRYLAQELAGLERRSEERARGT